MRVSYTGITSAFQADERGPIPLTRSLDSIQRIGSGNHNNKKRSPSATAFYYLTPTS